MYRVQWLAYCYVRIHSRVLGWYSWGNKTATWPVQQFGTRAIPAPTSLTKQFGFSVCLFIHIQYLLLPWFLMCLLYECSVKMNGCTILQVLESKNNQIVYCIHILSMADRAATELTRDHGRSIAGEGLSETSVMRQGTTVEFSEHTIKLFTDL